MAEKVTGPASYLPSIEKKYGRPVEEWLELIRQGNTCARSRGGRDVGAPPASAFRRSYQTDPRADDYIAALSGWRDGPRRRALSDGGATLVLLFQPRTGACPAPRPAQG